MTQDQYMDQFISQGLNTLIAAIIIIVFSALVFLFLRRKHTNKKHKHRIRSRVIYIAIVIFFLVIIRIWIEGFTHLFTMLSLVAAGLVVTNKENIMNFTGWIIINWRGLFSEGDHIQVQNYVGEVIDIKLLYFTMNEMTGFGETRTTGKLIKIPNALIITNSISVFSTDENVILHKIPYVTMLDDKSITVAEFIRVEMSKLLENQYSDLVANTKVKQKNQMHVLLHQYDVEVDFKLYSDKEKLVNIQTSFYCLAEDANKLEQQLIHKLTSYISSYPNS